MEGTELLDQADELGGRNPKLWFCPSLASDFCQDLVIELPQSP